MVHADGVPAAMTADADPAAHPVQVTVAALPSEQLPAQHSSREALPWSGW
jgi:hypothetical protein